MTVGTAPGTAPTRAALHSRSTLALAALTTVGVASLARYQARAGFVWPVVAMALVAHAVAWARRRGLPNTRLPLTAVAVALLAAWTVVPETTAYGIPTGATWTEVTHAVGRLVSALSSVPPGVPDPEGLLLLLMLLTGAGATVADRAAFAMHAPFLAMGPSLAFFVVGAVGRSPAHRTLAIVAYLGALLAFLAAHERDVRSAGAAWFEPHPRRTAVALRPAVVLGVVVVAGALVLGPRLPGQGIRPINGLGNPYDLRHLCAARHDCRPGALPGPAEDGSGPTTGGFRVSSLVDVRGSLIEQSDVEMFNVWSNLPSYWRLTSLDRFDGSTWSSSGTVGPVVTLAPPGWVGGGSVDQDFTIGALESTTLPVAHQPQSVDGLPASYDAGTSTLLSQSETVPGLRYRAVSQLARPDPALLARAGTTAPPDIVDRNLPPLLPLSARVVDEARRVTAQATKPGGYGAALALQDHFRRNFTYDLSAPPGSGGDALERFLFTTRRGYCEQFAGAFAAMARAVGLPTRVAVGFTPGTLQADGRYHVRGLHAHAWPEVYFTGTGWVAFEPTPGRAVPGGERYTGVPDPLTGTGPLGTTGPTGTETTQPTPTSASTVPTTAPVRGGAPTPLPDRQAGDTPGVPLDIVVPIGSAVVLVAIAVALERLRRRRRTAAFSPGDRVLMAWVEASEALARTGARRRPSETVTEFARRAPEDVDLGAEPAELLSVLAELTNAASYAEADLAGQEVDTAVRASAGVVGELQTRRSVAGRLAGTLDPRVLRSR